MYVFTVGGLFYGVWSVQWKHLMLPCLTEGLLLFAISLNILYIELNNFWLASLDYCDGNILQEEKLPLK